MHIILLLGVLLSGSVDADNQLGLPPLEIPADNPQTADKIALGRDFFHDGRFSSDGSISCASCHRPDRAFSDGLSVAEGIAGQRGLRNTPTIINAAFYRSLFHDGRAASLEQQALGPLLNPIEHGLKNREQILAVVKRDSDYRRRLMRVFAITEQQITARHVAKAIASYERTQIAGNSPFDRYYFGRDRSRLTTSAARGLLVFRRKGNCANCHEISMNHALFSDNRFYNIGIGSKQLSPVIDEFVEALRQGKNSEQYPLTAKQRAELGRFNVTKVVADIGKFKTPSLRNVALTAPYMHDGSLQTLEEVVDYYDKGGNNNRFQDPAIFPLHLTEREKADLIAFLHSLNSMPDNPGLP
ncbi:cytochrome-c peroxidase [Methylomarinum vadi]|uniref:cytochrome-c peroxidase n=1 Tax=Methylomarinum vadi TaxID=438855 RepID=UPI00056243A4|nr:cytochrome c peroxidase [Methylomarinum vadi]